MDEDTVHLAICLQTDDMSKLANPAVILRFASTAAIASANYLKHDDAEPHCIIPRDLNTKATGYQLLAFIHRNRSISGMHDQTVAPTI